MKKVKTRVDVTPTGVRYENQDLPFDMVLRNTGDGFDISKSLFLSRVAKGNSLTTEAGEAIKYDFHTYQIKKSDGTILSRVYGVGMFLRNWTLKDAVYGSITATEAVAEQWITWKSTAPS